MEFNLENFNELLKENNTLKRNREATDIRYIYNEYKGCPWTTVGNCYPEIAKFSNLLADECSGKCKECKEDFWDSCHSYLSDKYKL